MNLDATAKNADVAADDFKLFWKELVWLAASYLQRQQTEAAHLDWAASVCVGESPPYALVCDH